MQLAFPWEESPNERQQNLDKNENERNTKKEDHGKLLPQCGRAELKGYSHSSWKWNSMGTHTHPESGIQWVLTFILKVEFNGYSHSSWKWNSMGTHIHPESGVQRWARSELKCGWVPRARHGVLDTPGRQKTSAAACMPCPEPSQTENNLHL